MRIAILDGSPEQGGLSRYTGDFTAILHERGHDVKLFALRELDIKYCTGCWSCWWKTPGECAFRDDADAVRAAVVNSDFTLLASPLIMGFISALLKKVQDKLIPIVHPYVKLVRGESRHRKRYDRYHVIGLLLEPREDTDDDDIALTVEMQSAMALDLRTHLALARLVRTPPRELADEVDRAQRLATR